ncbi:MAG: LptF/LptG family permease [Bacteroidia bacterium]|nr:LptF/LptG family permease [Bacteroidia bacterium]
MKLKKLHILIFKTFAGPFIVTFFVSLFLFLLQFLWKYIGDLIGKGLEWYVILEFVGYSAIHLIPLALPLAVLLSSIMAFGNLGENYELVAMKSAGISLIKIFVPMYVIILSIAAFAFYSSNILIPKANLSWGALLYDVSNKKPAFNIKEGVFFRDIQGYAIKIGKKNADNKTIEDILIYINNSGRGNNNIVLAKSGIMQLSNDEKFLSLKLYDGIKYQEMTENTDYYSNFQHNIMQFKSQEISIDLTDLQFKRTRKELFKDDYRMMNVNELKAKIDSLRKIIDARNSLTYDYILPYFHTHLDSSKKYVFDKKLLKLKYHQTLGNFKELRDQFEKTYMAEDVYSASKHSNLTNGLSETIIEKRKSDSKTDSSKNYKPEILENSKFFARNILSIIETSYKDVLSQRENQLKYEVEFNKKFSLAVSCILLFFIGAPMGAIIRRGGFGWPMVISVILFILYFSINLIGEKLARGEVVPAYISIWLSTLIILPFSVFLTYKANKDDKIFEKGVSIKWFDKLLERKTKPDFENTTSIK